MCDPLVHWPMKDWNDLRKELKKHGTTGISGHAQLDIEEEVYKYGDSSSKVYCPYGKLSNGFVRIAKMLNYSRVFICCPQDDIKELKEALRYTKLIDWSQHMEIMFASGLAENALYEIMVEKNVVFGKFKLVLLTFYIKDDAPYHDVMLSPDFAFKPLTLEYSKIANDTWPYRHASSLTYFERLIKTKCGYGLFVRDELVAWSFVKHEGDLGHVYTLEGHRRKGYGELVLKLISNMLREQGKYVLSYCTVDNEVAKKAYVKAGFTAGHGALWGTIKPKSES